MNREIKKPAWMLAGLLAASVAFADLFESGDINQAIPDGNEFGICDTLTVTGMAGVITDISVSLAISGTGYGAYNGDLYAYILYRDDVDALFAVLLNRVGKTDDNPYGSWDDGFDVTFTMAGNDIHNASPDGGILTGEWGADGRETDPADVVDTDIRTATLDQFIGSKANGSWTLFVADLSVGGTAQLDSWSVNIEAVPEPTVVGLLAISGGLMLIIRRITAFLQA
jgi:subtilisin-like proprotein convertase family protein